MERRDTTTAGSVTLNGITRHRHAIVCSPCSMWQRDWCTTVVNFYDRITPLLRDLHWLRVPERIQFRLGVHLFLCRNQTRT